MTCSLATGVRARQWMALGAVLAAVGCKGDDTGANDTGSQATSIAPVDTGADDGDGMLSSDFEPICEPGEVRCAGASLETCAGTGASWEAEACAENTVCVPCGPDDVGCSVARCVGACEATSMVPSSAGCEFIANRQLHLLEDVPDAVIVANPDENVVATVQFFQIDEGTNDEVLIETVTLQPNEDFTLKIDNDFVAGSTSFLRSGGMFRIRSDFPVIAYQHSPFQNNVGNDSSMLLPDSVLGTVYVVTTYNPHAAQQSGLGRPTYFEVITLQKGTWVEWTPPVPTFGTGSPIDPVAAGETGRHTQLNRYDTLRIAASAEFEDEFPPISQDLSGTVIRSSDPIWVVAGSRCSRVPVRAEPEAGFCDPLQEVLIPVAHWGTEYVAMHPPLRENENHYWRVFSGGDNVTFTTEPQVLTAENCAPPATFADGACTLPTLGSWIEIEVANGESFVVKGNKAPDDAVMVVGYLQSRHLPGEPEDAKTSVGDPAMYQTVPTEQFLGRYVFRTAEGFTDYVQFVRPSGNATVFLDGIGVQSWETVGEFEFATVKLDELPVTIAHTAESSDPFGVSVFGYSDANVVDFETCLAANGKCASSYAYPGGMKSQELYIP